MKKIRKYLTMLLLMLVAILALQKDIVQATPDAEEDQLLNVFHHQQTLEDNRVDPLGSSAKIGIDSLENLEDINKVQDNSNGSIYIHRGKIVFDYEIEKVRGEYARYVSVWAEFIGHNGYEGTIKSISVRGQKFNVNDKNWGSRSNPNVFRVKYDGPLTFTGVDSWGECMRLIFL